MFIRKSHWTINARWLLIAALLSTAVAGRELVATPGPLLLVCAGMICYNVAAAASRWAWSHAPQATFVSLLLDEVALTGYLHFAGDVENPLRLLYFLPAAVASIALPLRAGLAIATCGTLLYGLLGCLTWAQVFPWRLTHHHLALFDPAIHSVIEPGTSARGNNYLLVQLFRFSLMTFGAAIGFGVLGRKLRTAGSVLASQDEQLRVLLHILPEGVVLLSPEGEIRHSNWAAREYLGAWSADRVSDLDPAGGLVERFQNFRGPVEEFEMQERDKTLHHTMARTAERGPIVWLIRDVGKLRHGNSNPLPLPGKPGSQQPPLL